MLFGPASDSRQPGIHAWITGLVFTSLFKKITAYQPLFLSIWVGAASRLRSSSGKAGIEATEKAVSISASMPILHLVIAALQAPVVQTTIASWIGLQVIRQMKGLFVFILTSRWPFSNAG